jgi:hypothetical protein
VLIAICLLGIFARAWSDETWLTVGVRSYHVDRRGQEEWNFGAGLERRYSAAWAGGIGAYRNSSGDASLYAVAAYSAFQRGSWRFGAVGGVVSGYEPDACVLGGLMASVEGKRMGVNLIFVPGAGGVAFAQFKWRLD